MAGPQFSDTAAQSRPYLTYLAIRGSAQHMYPQVVIYHIQQQPALEVPCLGSLYSTVLGAYSS